MNEWKFSPGEEQNEEYKERYSEKFGKWFEHLPFRLTMYIVSIVFLLMHIATFSKLYESGAMESGEAGLSFVFSVLGVLLSALLIADISKGVVHFALARLGKHRAFIICGLVAAVAFGLVWTQPESLPEKDPEGYMNFVWVMSTLVAMEFVRGGIFDRDLSRLRGVIDE